MSVLFSDEPSEGNEMPEVRVHEAQAEGEREQKVMIV